MKKLMLCLAVVILLSGCMTTNFENVRSEVVKRVDPISITDYPKFDSDTVFCAEMAFDEADRVQREMVGRAIGGALIGAAYGAAIGSAFGKQYTGFGAQVGATQGAMAGMSSVQSRYYIIMTNCLLHRGYLLLW